MSKPKVAFVCVHNSCRSQIAQALGQLLMSDVFESYSAGTHPAKAINADAVRLIKKLYDIDMTKTQHPKMIENIPNVDVVITMGCNVNCPIIPNKYQTDWNLDDPSHQEDEVFLKVIDTIHYNILQLGEKIKNNQLY